LRSHWFSRLSRAAARQGNLAIPLIKQLTELVAKKDRDAANFVDWGASSQDIIDTCRVLQLRQALDLIARDLQSIAEPLVALAEKHRLTFIAGRTWMKHALPTTLGLQDRRVSRRGDSASPSVG